MWLLVPFLPHHLQGCIGACLTRCYATQCEQWNLHRLHYPLLTSLEVTGACSHQGENQIHHQVLVSTEVFFDEKTSMNLGGPHIEALPTDGNRQGVTNACYPPKFQNRRNLHPLCWLWPPSRRMKSNHGPCWCHTLPRCPESKIHLLAWYQKPCYLLIRSNRWSYSSTPSLTHSSQGLR